MHIYFDLDETMVDEEGAEVRPGLRTLLEKLASDGHQLSLWTASTEDRASRILEKHRLLFLFDIKVFRDDYDPRCSGHPKDIRYCDGDLLVDDDPSQIAFVRSIGGKGLHVQSFHSDSKKLWRDDSSEIYRQITQMALES